MERALDLGRLTEALGDRSTTPSPQSLPTPERLRELLADAEMRIFLRQTEIPEDLIRTGWYLHGVASINAALELYSYVRQRRAFEISAHIFDLALNDEARSRREKLSLAFGAQIGYRRAELDPNATAIFGLAERLIIREPPIEAHSDSLALEAGVALLGFQTRTLFDLYEQWLRQLHAVQRQAGIDDLWGTLFGEPHRVVLGCNALLKHLAFGREEDLENARAAFRQVVTSEHAVGDLDARWVAAHLLDFTSESAAGSIWRVLPPDVPDVARQAFTLASPPVLTLWPPQRRLFAPPEGPQPLASDVRRVVLSIPTSSGKTLLAQLMIVVHLARGGGGICYVAPLRSLGREVRRALRNRLRIIARELGGAELPDFGPLLDLSNAATSNDEAMDQSPGEPSVAQLLRGVTPAGGQPDVEVMTPERLSHMLHRDPESLLDRFQMFVFDEAHFLAERGRGFILESILSFIHWRTLNTNHRIILLSAALGNEGQIMSWLDPNKNGTAIRSQWRGPRRLHAIFTTRPDWEKRTESRVQSKDWPIRINYPLRGVIRLQPAEGATARTLTLSEPVGTLALRYDENGNLRKTKTQTPKDPQHSTPQYKMAAQMVSALGAFGSVLVVTSTRRAAQDMARELASLVDKEAPGAIALADMAVQRLGAAHPLSSVLRKGVAFHHAALPVDVLEELEEALRHGTLRFMTCTSTLTEGVNLPVRTVVLAETQWDDATTLLSGPRLVNAMGRAGRAGKESEGWIVLVRGAKEHADDFDLMSPASEELAIRSRLATDEALKALAEFEETVRSSEDATFTVAAGACADFLAFVWFLLSSEEARGIPPDRVRLSAALDATLAFVQADEMTRNRWRTVAEIVRSSYIDSDTQRRRYWARTGTSIATARLLDDLAAVVVQRVLEHIDREGDVFAAELARAEGVLTLLAEASVLSTLLSLSENDRPWRFRQTRSGQSADLVVSPETLLREWVRGRSIPSLAETFLQDATEHDWRVEQIVDAVAQHFEHFLAWMLGALVELVNERLARHGIQARLCEELPNYVRYGVDSETALRLLVSGVRSRRLALAIAVNAAAEQIPSDSLRHWLGAMGIAELRRRFSASSSELLDLLEFTRTPQRSLLRDLLEHGRAEIKVQQVERERGHRGNGDLVAHDHASTDESSAAEAEQAPFVDLRQVPGDELPPRLGVFRSTTGELVALVPTPVYGDVQSILDTGVPIRGTLRDETLELVLAPEPEA